MAANIDPIWTKNGNANGVPITAANTSSEGGGTIGTNIFLAFTAGAAGAFVKNVQFAPTATAPTTTTATVARVFLSSKSAGATTSADTWLLGEVALPAASADSATVANNVFNVPIDRPIPAGYTILVTNHAAPAAATQWVAVAFGGDY